MGIRNVLKLLWMYKKNLLVILAPLILLPLPLAVNTQVCQVIESINIILFNENSFKNTAEHKPSYLIHKVAILITLIII